MAWWKRRGQNSAALVRGLRGSEDWRDEEAALADLLSAQPQVAHEIAAALDDDLRRNGFDVAVTAVRRFLLEQTTRSTHRDATATAVELGARPGPVDPATPDPDYRRARNAMQLAGTRPAEDLQEILEDERVPLCEDMEFGLLLAHELVVRGVVLPVPAARRYLDWASETGHDLAVLPPRLLPIEERFPEWLPRYGGVAGSSSQGVPDQKPTDAVRLGDLIDGFGPSVAVDVDSVRMPFEDWVDFSNGRIAVRAFEPGTDYSEELPEPRLHGDRAAGRLEPRAAIERLFSASVLSGAYSHGPGGAYSRLRAWRACAALVDHDWPADLVDLAFAAERARWYQVDPKDTWFDDVAWNVWLLVEASGRIVVIAATDTD